MSGSYNFRNKKNQPQNIPKKPCMQCHDPTSAPCEGSRQSWFQHSKETEARRDAIEKAKRDAEQAKRDAERKADQEKREAEYEAERKAENARRKAEFAEHQAAFLDFKNKLADMLNCSLETLEALIESTVFTNEIISEFMKHGYCRPRTPAMVYPRFAAIGVEGEQMCNANTASLYSFFESPSAAYDKMPHEIQILCNMNNNTIILENGCAILRTLIDHYWKRKVSFLQNGVVIYSITEIRDESSAYCNYFNTDYEIQRFKEDPINKLGDKIARADTCPIM